MTRRLQRESLSEVKDGLVKLRADFAERRQAVSTKLQPLGITDIPETDISSLVESLKAAECVAGQVKKRRTSRNRLPTSTVRVKRLDAVIETQSTALAEKLERLEA
jgi:exonuclease SbcC